MENINYFMCLYMYLLEQELSRHKNEIMKVSFQSDEANTDRPLKEYLKHYIEGSFSSIPENDSIDSVSFEGISFSNFNEIKRMTINRVLLPEELTKELKERIKESKISVYTNPDLLLEINNGDELTYESIELKSTKNDSIPGSSIQQIIPEEWVIFIKHDEKGISISTGQYVHAINSKMQFPDRSPRPQVSYKTMHDWNELNRIIKGNNLLYKIDNNDSEKRALITDWQNVLSQRWIDVLFNATTAKTNEPWFNNTLRKFILFFLEKYDELSECEKETFKKNVSSLISSHFE